MERFRKSRTMRKLKLLFNGGNKRSRRRGSPDLPKDRTLEVIEASNNKLCAYFIFDNIRYKGFW